MVMRVVADVVVVFTIYFNGHMVVHDCIELSVKDENRSSKLFAFEAIMSSQLIADKSLLNSLEENCEKLGFKIVFLTGLSRLDIKVQN